MRYGNRTTTLQAFLLLFALALAGCVGRLGASLPPADEILIPQIHEDGTKFFTFQRLYSRPADDGADVVPGRGGARQRGGFGSNNPQLMDEEIELRLTEVLLATGYCREGYFERYRDSTRSAFSLRGECREIASDADRARFDGSPIPL